MERKINIEISLSKNYNKISLGLLDEPIVFENGEEFRKLVKEKFALLKELVLAEFEEGEVKVVDTPTTPQMATEPQKKFLVGLGYQDDMTDLTKDEASEKIAILKGNGSY